MIMDEIRKYGWLSPCDAFGNSTNCLLNAFAIDVHIKRYGFHASAWEIANIVGEGVVTREEGYKKIYAKLPESSLNAFNEKLFKDSIGSTTSGSFSPRSRPHHISRD